ncbi:MAG: tetratricopeptide repeat protein [Henriciella sp.]
MNVYIQYFVKRRSPIGLMIALGLLSGLGATAQSSARTYHTSSPPAAACADGVATTDEAGPALLRTCRDALAARDLSRSDRAATLVNTGILEMRRGDSSEALALFEQASVLDTDLPDIRINIAAAQIRGGTPDLALDTLSEIESVAPSQRHIALFNRGLAYWHLEDFGRAYADFSRAAELRPDYAAALNMLDHFTVDTPAQAHANLAAHPG